MPFSQFEIMSMRFASFFLFFEKLGSFSEWLHFKLVPFANLYNYSNLIVFSATIDVLCSLPWLVLYHLRGGAFLFFSLSFKKRTQFSSLQELAAFIFP
jgi:hypothetical protein